MALRSNPSSRRSAWHKVRPLRPRDRTCRPYSPDNPPRPASSIRVLCAAKSAAAQKATLLDVKRLHLFGNVIALGMASVKTVAGGLQTRLRGCRWCAVLPLTIRRKRVRPALGCHASCPHQAAPGSGRRFRQSSGAVLLQHRDAQVDDGRHGRHLDVMVGDAVCHIPVDSRWRDSGAPPCPKATFTSRFLAHQKSGPALLHRWSKRRDQ